MKRISSLKNINIVKTPNKLQLPGNKPLLAPVIELMETIIAEQTAKMKNQEN